MCHHFSARRSRRVESGCVTSSRRGTRGGWSPDVSPVLGEALTGSEGRFPRKRGPPRAVLPSRRRCGLSPIGVRIPRHGLNRGHPGELGRIFGAASLAVRRGAAHDGARFRGRLCAHIDFDRVHGGRLRGHRLPAVERLPERKRKRIGTGRARGDYGALSLTSSSDDSASQPIGQEHSQPERGHQLMVKGWRSRNNRWAGSPLRPRQSRGRARRRRSRGGLHLRGPRRR